MLLGGGPNNTDRIRKLPPKLLCVTNRTPTTDPPLILLKITYLKTESPHLVGRATPDAAGKARPTGKHLTIMNYLKLNKFCAAANGQVNHSWPALAHHRLAQLFQQQHADAERKDEQPHFCVQRRCAEQRVAPRRVADQQQQ